MQNRRFGQLKIGAMISYFTMAFSIVSGLVYTPWMVAKIGQAEYGLYTLANSLIAIFMLDFGLGSAVSRYVAKYRAEGKYDAISNLLGVIYKLYIAIDIVILAILSVLYFFVGTIYKELSPEELETFRTLYLIVAGYHIIAFPFSPQNGVLNAYEKFIQQKLCTLLYHIMSVAAVVAVLFFTADVTIVIFANVCSHLATILLRLYFIRKYVPQRVNFKAKGRTLYKTLFSFTVWATVISIMQRFTHSFAPSVLGMTAGAIQIALYAPAVSLEGYFYTLGTAINGMFLPRVSKYIADKQEGNILQLMIRVGRYQAMLLGLVFIGFVCIGKEFMTLWMGSDYTNTYYLAIVILLPTLISSTQQIAKTTVIAKKLIKHQALCMSVTGVLGLVVSYVLSSRIGAMGVCIGTALTSLCNIFYMNIIYKKKAGIDIVEFYKKCYLPIIPCYAAVICVGLLVAKYITISGWLGLAVKAVVISVFFAVVVFFFYMTKEEKKQYLRIKY